MTDNKATVMLLCVPRSMSTVLAKCISAIDDMEVYLELYSYAAYIGGMFESSTGCKLPLKLDGNESDYEKAKEMFKTASTSSIIPKRISCHDIKTDIENTKSKYVFIKEMALFTDYVHDIGKYLPRRMKYVFMIREPSRVYASYRKGLQTSGIFGPSDGDFDLIRDDQARVRPMTWYERQHKLWKYVKEDLDPNAIIIDALDLASRPKEILKGLCDAVGFPYSDSLLQWSPSCQDFPKNFVTAGEDLFQGMSVFYARAFSCTHFEAPTACEPIPRDQLTDDVIRCTDFSMPFYRDMYEHRMQGF